MISILRLVQQCHGNNIEHVCSQLYQHLFKYPNISIETLNMFKSYIFDKNRHILSSFNTIIRIVSFTLVSNKYTILFILLFPLHMWMCDVTEIK